MNTLKTLIAVFFIGTLIDFLGFFTFLGTVFKKELSGLLRMAGTDVSPRWGVVVCVYIALAVLIVFFALPKVDAGNVAKTALLWGALLGFCVYGVYEFTNYSLLKDWTLKTLLIDLCWGTFFGAVLTYISYYVQKFFLN